MSAKTFLIGIAGGSCSGKTCIARHLSGILPSVAVINLDSYYHDLSSLDFDTRQHFNFDHPCALDHRKLISDLKCLTRGKTINRPVYDFTTHTRLNRLETVTPSSYLIVEGLFTLYWRALRELLHFKVFVAAEHGVCFERRRKRDTEERGRSIASIQQQYSSTVRPMFEEFVLPTQRFANLVIDGQAPISRSVHQIFESVWQQNLNLSRELPLVTSA